jgi:hypothetical protein
MGDGQLFTWDTLGTISGAALFLFFFVQYTKALVDKYLKFLPTDIYVILVAWAILMITQLARGSNMLDWRLYALAFANAFIVASTSSHMLQKSLNPPVTRPRTASTVSETVLKTVDDVKSYESKMITTEFKGPESSDGTSSSSSTEYKAADPADSAIQPDETVANVEPEQTELNIEQDKIKPDSEAEKVLTEAEKDKIKSDSEAP